MGRRGPQPKPTQLRVLEGRVQHRALPPREPQPRIGAPPCPRWLDPAARAEWSLIVDEWARSAPKLLTRVDGGVLEAYCKARARWIQAEQDIDADLAKPRGRLDRSKVLIAAKYAAQVVVFGDRLGLSPAARTRISLPDEGEEDAAGILS